MPPKSESRSSLKAWLVVVAAFTGAFVSFGVTYTFGVFLRPISTTFGVTHATMSGLFAVIAALTFKTDVLWAQLDALHHAYVCGAIPPGAFRPE